MYHNNLNRDNIFKPVFLFFSVFVFLLASLLSGCRNAAPETETKQKTDSIQTPKLNYLTNCKSLFTEAGHMDSILLKQNEIDLPSANKAIKAFTDFAYHCQSDSMSPVYLIKTAQVARAVNNIPQAKMVLDHCIENYPNFKDRDAAIFLLAQLYDEVNYLNDENEARKLYQKIIDEYPKSVWVASAKGAIDFIGKSDEEIMQQLTKKKHKK